MLQYRRNDPSRRRRIKRDVASAPKKGVAGLRMEAEPTSGVSTDSNDAVGDRTDAAASDNVTSLLDSLNINDEQDENE